MDNNKNKNYSEEFIPLLKEQILFSHEFIMKDLIGVGPIAKVYKLFLSDFNKKLAIKVIEKKIQKNLVMPYINFMKNVKKPFLAKMYTYVEDDNYYYIIMDYYEFNLGHFIKNGLSIQKIFKIIEKLNSILQELNAKHIIFRNIKPENIFIINGRENLEGNFDLILSDCCNNYFLLYRNDSNKKNLAPEIVSNNELKDNSDLYSLGALFAQMIFSIYIEKTDYIFHYKFISCIKYDKFRNFLNSLIEKEANKRKQWKEYFEEFSQLKKEISIYKFDDFIDFTKFNSINNLNGLFELDDGFDNIIIQLTELSKKEYVNEKNLIPFDFDKRGNKLPYAYSNDQKRGGLIYNPPFGWVGIGLNISNYENWQIRCGKTNQKGEWCVAYHGTSISNAKNIITDGLMEGNRQYYSKHKDQRGNDIGTGVYFSPSINVAEQYSKPYEGIKCVFMCRVNPEKMKQPVKDLIYVINDPEMDIIPYRLLIKWD